MEDRRIAEILQGLGSSDSQDAWREFLEGYAPLLLQVARYSEPDPDSASDCFLFLCEHLSREGFRRLRRFRVGGAASFSTWLRAVSRNLCLDWRRHRHGRPRREGAVPTRPIEVPLEEVRDPAPGPEMVAACNERQAALASAVGRLPAEDRLLLRMRFEQELTLEQIARTTGLKDAQSVDRRIRGILAALRKDLG